jgi:hypothetical protein
LFDKQLHREGYGNFRFEWLPAYAPDLTPVETLWSYTKCSDLAVFLLEDQHELRRSVCRSFKAQRRQQTLVRSFYHAAKLTLGSASIIAAQASKVDMYKGPHSFWRTVLSGFDIKSELQRRSTLLTSPWRLGPTSRTVDLDERSFCALGLT